MAEARIEFNPSRTAHWTGPSARFNRMEVLESGRQFLVKKSLMNWTKLNPSITLRICRNGPALHIHWCPLCGLDYVCLTPVYSKYSCLSTLDTSRFKMRLFLLSMHRELWCMIYKKTCWITPEWAPCFGLGRKWSDLSRNWFILWWRGTCPQWKCIQAQNNGSLWCASRDPRVYWCISR
jgi:hypothetical protein